MLHVKRLPRRSGCDFNIIIEKVTFMGYDIMSWIVAHDRYVYCNVNKFRKPRKRSRWTFFVQIWVSHHIHSTQNLWNLHWQCACMRTHCCILHRIYLIESRSACYIRILNLLFFRHSQKTWAQLCMYVMTVIHYIYIYIYTHTHTNTHTCIYAQTHTQPIFTHKCL
jgi:hypothetical protein